MNKNIQGNIKGLPHSVLKRLSRLFERGVDTKEVISRDLAREILSLAIDMNRRVGLLIGRDGIIEQVIVGTYDIIYLPDLGRYRLGPGRLRRLRLVFTDISKNTEPSIPSDVMADLEKLRLDMVVGIRSNSSSITAVISHLVPPERKAGSSGTRTEIFTALNAISFDVGAMLTDLEAELTSFDRTLTAGSKPRAMLVAVGPQSERDVALSLRELTELAETAGVEVIDTIIQKRVPDPKSLLGKGKLEEVILRCLRYGIDILIFNSELKPGQWRIITNTTELKTLDRSMVILDIFAQRAQSSEGRLQVELAQLKYNLPRLVERDSGLSRLTGGIGGRGPGETKLEISRRRSRDRITDLERRIKEIEKQRIVRKGKRKGSAIPLVAIVGYTNAGKSTLFNMLTKATVLVENKLFATLDPFQRKVSFDSGEGVYAPVIISDTVGFIRDLPEELITAFKATLEELYEASLLIHLIDVSDPDCEVKRSSVRNILKAMNLDQTPVLDVGNKADLLGEEIQRSLLQPSTEGGDSDYSIFISAKCGSGISSLRTVIADTLKKV